LTITEFPDTGETLHCCLHSYRGFIFTDIGDVYISSCGSGLEYLPVAEGDENGTQYLGA
jgi:hypothetical protein